MSQTMNYSIKVTFIRANNTGDDVAKISADDEGNFHITMRFGNTTNGKTIIKTAIMDADELYCWFRKTFRLMDADYDPFEFYQFDFPLMPSVLIHHRELHHHYETIMNAVEFHLENWFNDVVYLDSEAEAESEAEQNTKSNPRHQFFESYSSDSDSSDSSLEEEEYQPRRRCRHTGKSKAVGHSG